MSSRSDEGGPAIAARNDGGGGHRSPGHDHRHDLELVAAVSARLPAPELVEDLGATFGLLADPGRLRLLMALLEGEMCVCDLALACGQSESGVSHALRLLRAHRVVAVRRSGRRAYYRLADAHVRMLLDLALTHHEHAIPVAAVPTVEEVR